MAVSRTVSVLTLLLLYTLAAAQVGMPIDTQAGVQATTPTAQETTVAALEANAARYTPGLMVTEVDKGSPVEQAGVKVGDVLLALDGVELRFGSQITVIRDRARWNDAKTMTLTVQRGAQRLELSVTMAPSFGIEIQIPLPEASQKLFAEAMSLPREQKAGQIVKLKAAAVAAEQSGDARVAAYLWDLIVVNAPDGSDESREAMNSTLRQAIKAGDALLVASSLDELGYVSRVRGRLDVAEDLFQRALSIREKWAPNSLDMADNLSNLGAVTLERGQLDTAENSLQRALAIAEKLAPNSLDMAKSLSNRGAVAFNRGRLDEAEAFFQRALAIAEKLAPNSLDMASSLSNLGLVAYDRGRLDEAEAFFQRALSVREKLAPNSLEAADGLNNLGIAALDRGQLDTAENFLQRALAIEEKLAPNSLEAAETLGNLGIAALDRSQLDTAENFLQRALAIAEKLAPNSLEMAKSLNNLGSVAQDRGQLDTAESFLQRALSIREKLAPNSLEVANSLNNLGSVAQDRGQLDTAESFLQRALSIREKLAPNSLDMASTLTSLGGVAQVRGQLDAAEAFSQHALSIREKLAPNSLEVADSLNNLGLVALDRGQLDTAENFLRRALAIKEKLAPNSLKVAGTLNNLGFVAHKRGQLDSAEMFYQRALSIREKLAPNSLDVAICLNNLGLVAYGGDHLDTAENFLQRSLAIKERLAPNSLDVAISLNNLGLVAYSRDHLDKAEVQLHDAWNIIWTLGRQVAGDNGRQEFGQAYAYVAANLLAIQILHRRPDAAFVTLEEGRAQALVQVMAERGITEKVTSPEVWHSYQQAVSKYNLAFKAAEQSAVRAEKASRSLQIQQEQQADSASLQAKQHDLDVAMQVFAAKRDAEVGARTEMESRWAEVRRADKVALPEPIDANLARTRLSAGTLVLEFSVSQKQVILFTVTAAGVNVYLLDTPRAELEARAKFVRRLVAQDTDDRTATLVNDADDRNDALRTLFSKLFPAEVQTAIQQAKHVVISPDDFLWDLPFGALISNKGGPPSFLAQQKPLSYTQSLALYLQAAQADNLAHVHSAFPAGSEVLVVGNPLYDNARRVDMLAQAHGKTKATAATTSKLASTTKSGAKIASARREGELGTLTSDGTAPPQLPYAEKEAEQIAKLYHTSPHTGVEPTEAWFRQHIANARIIHLATHGFLNPFAPQASGILLAVPAVMPPPGQYDNDGALQAWEVWSLKLHADLVVLSACETGRGAQVPDEGLVGLTRAWQYAGAKTVVSSLWKVSDASTATLMTAFHKYLLAGKDKDEALRLAMVETASARSGIWSNPHYWAAFVLVGDTGRLR